MSDEFQRLPELRMHVGERKNFTYDVTQRLSSGVTLGSATATLMDPHGNEASLGTACTVTGALAIATILGEEIDEVGIWVLKITAVLSNSETPKAWLDIVVT